MNKKAPEVSRKRPNRQKPTVEDFESLRKNWSRLMSEDEVAFLRDLQGFIDFAIRNGLIFPGVVGTLLSDLNEITRDGLDYAKARARGFKPKVSGYSQLTSDDFGESDDESAD